MGSSKNTCGRAHGGPPWKNNLTDKVSPAAARAVRLFKRAQGRGSRKGSGSGPTRPQIRGEGVFLPDCQAMPQ